MTRARWMMERFRDVATCLGLHYPGGDAPSTGLLGLYLSMQICGKVSVYGLGAPRASWERAVNTSATTSDLAAELASRQATGWGDISDRALSKGLSQEPQGGSRNSANEEPERVFDGGTPMARIAWTQNLACRAYGIRPTTATWRLPIKQSPYPYHYFLKWPDSARLYPHGHHDFESESDFMFLMHLGSPRLAFCPPADPCEGSMTSACRNVVLPVCLGVVSPSCRPIPSFRRMKPPGDFGSTHHYANLTFASQLQEMAIELAPDSAARMGENMDINEVAP